MLRYSKAGVVILFRGAHFSDKDSSERKLVNVIVGLSGKWLGFQSLTDRFSRRGNNAGNIAKSL